MNNFEKIKSMSLDEMADFFSSTKPKACGLCIGQYTGCLREVSCKGAIKEWLQDSRPAQFLDNRRSEKCQK